MHRGRFRTRLRVNRKIRFYGFWCLICETWWIVEVAVARRPNREDWTTVSPARSASEVESREAERVLFRKRGLAVPFD